MYSKSYLKEKILNSFQVGEVEGQLANLIAEVLSEYSYINQIIDVNTLMENSFQRCAKLNSSIQHASDMFYSVPRGYNTVVSIENLTCINDIDSPYYPFDLITKASSGKYKLFAKNIWNLAKDQTYNLLEGYLALDSITRTITGQNKLYLDVGVQNPETGMIQPDQNISEQIVVYLVYTDNNSDMVADFQIGNLKYKQVKLYNDKNEFWGKDNEDIDPSEPEPLLAITTPNYGVRLWCKTSIPSSNTYEVRYLVAPDSTVFQAEPSQLIKKIPDCLFSTDTVVKTSQEIEYPLTNQDAIFLYSSSSRRMGGMVKSINSLDVAIQACFPEFKNYKIIIGACGNEVAQSAANDTVYIQNVVNYIQAYSVTEDTNVSLPTPDIYNYVPANNIYIWYVLDKEPNHNSEGYKRDYTILNPEHLAKWENMLKAYYIPDNTQITFHNVNELLIPYDATVEEPSEHIRVLDDYRISIYYQGNLNFSAVESILDQYQLQIGQDFNPYQIMSSLTTDSNLYGIIKYVAIEKKEGDNYVPAGILKIAKDQRYWFKQSYSNLIRYVQNG